MSLTCLTSSSGRGKREKMKIKFWRWRYRIGLEYYQRRNSVVDGYDDIAIKFIFGWKRRKKRGGGEVAKIPIKELIEVGKRLDDEDIPLSDRKGWDGEKIVKISKRRKRGRKSRVERTKWNKR